MSLRGRVKHDRHALNNLNLINISLLSHLCVNWGGPGVFHIANLFPLVPAVLWGVPDVAESKPKGSMVSN